MINFRPNLEKQIKRAKMLVYNRSGLLVYLLFASSVCAKDYFTSTGEMTKLVETCERATNALEGFINEQSDRISKANK